MSDGRPVASTSLLVCTSCWQAFPDHVEWEKHADGPFADFIEANDALVTIDPGEAIPAGLRVGERKCYFPGEDLDPVEWTDIERDDLVYNDNAGRFVGKVGHRDDERVDVEPPDGGTVQIARADFRPDGKYRAIRL